MSQKAHPGGVLSDSRTALSASWKSSSSTLSSSPSGVDLWLSGVSVFAVQWRSVDGPSTYRESCCRLRLCYTGLSYHQSALQKSKVKKSVKNNEKRPLQPPSAFQAAFLIFKVFPTDSAVVLFPVLAHKSALK